MKTKEFKNKPEAELQSMLAELRAKLQPLRFDMAAGKIKNIREVRGIKKDIARILTFLNKK